MKRLALVSEARLAAKRSTPITETADLHEATHSTRGLPVPSRLLVPFASLALGAVLVALPGGCGSASNVPTTVKGIVQFQGYPLAGGTVAFAPDADRGSSGRPLTAEVQADGTFQLHASGSASVPPGWYRVAIADMPPPPGYSTTFAGFPSKLRRPDRSDLLRQVQPGKENYFEFLIEAGSR